MLGPTVLSVEMEVETESEGQPLPEKLTAAIVISDVSGPVARSTKGLAATRAGRMKLAKDRMLTGDFKPLRLVEIVARKMNTFWEKGRGSWGCQKKHSEDIQNLGPDRDMPIYMQEAKQRCSEAAGVDMMAGCSRRDRESSHRHPSE